MITALTAKISGSPLLHDSDVMYVDIIGQRRVTGSEDIIECIGAVIGTLSLRKYLDCSKCTKVSIIVGGMRKAMEVVSCTSEGNIKSKRRKQYNGY